jgi:hypothetical protein
MVRARSPLLACSATLAAALAVAFAGCGTGDDQDQARATVQQFAAALARGDGGAACSLLSEDLAQEIEQQEGKPCADAIGSLQVQPGAVDRVQVFITNAKADLAGGRSAFLDRAADGWRLSALACEPQGGKPADQPFDCEVQT